MNRRLLTAVVGTALGLGLAISGSAAAFADEPTVDLDGKSVVDTTGKAGDLATVQPAIDSLQSRAGLHLVVVYVSNFDDSSADEDSGWADSEASHLQITDPKTVVLAVAIDQRQYTVSVSGQAGLTDDQLTAAEQDDLVPALERSDWTGAAVAYARALGDLATGTSTGSAAAVAPPAGFDWAGAAPWLAPTGIIVIAIIVAVIIFIRIRYLRAHRS